MSKDEKTINMKTLIIGGGASGMTAAIFSAKKGDETIILEHNDRPGKKILSTGNGRCNLTNRNLKRDIDSHFANLGCADRSFYKNVIDRFGIDDTISFFEGLGLMMKDRGDLVYPLSDQASSVLDVLRFALDDLGVRVITSCNVSDASGSSDKGFKVTTDKGIFTSDKLIIATGSKAAPSTGSDGSGYAIASKFGHMVNEVKPGLVQLRSDAGWLKAVSGVRCSADLSLYDGDEMICVESGELQFTDYGLSGIVAMDISNRLPGCIHEPSVHIDLMPGESISSLRESLIKRKNIFPQRNAADLMSGTLNKKLGLLLLKLTGIRQDTAASMIKDEDIGRMSGLIKDLKVIISGTNGFKEAQICLGGVDCSEIDENMQSRIVPLLYFCGEILNLHGDCGGYNLQLAWSTGAIAGMA